MWSVQISDLFHVRTILFFFHFHFYSFMKLVGKKLNGLNI